MSRKRVSKVDKESPLESNPREPEGTIMGDMLKLKELIDKHYNIKEKRYGRMGR